jgi:hypothetical protein
MLTLGLVAFNGKALPPQFGMMRGSSPRMTRRGADQGRRAIGLLTPTELPVHRIVAMDSVLALRCFSERRR